jgi:hypothetical protein
MPGIFFSPGSGMYLQEHRLVHWRVSSRLENHDQQATSPGPSWGLMLFFILLAMLVAAGIAWAFIHPMFHQH